MNDPLVSIIIPIYNVEQYLRQCVDSVLSQTYRNLEIILVDDGSPDNSPVICDDYATKDDRVKVIHKENGGLSEARNFGIKNSNGSFIFFLDADDYIASQCIEKLLDVSSSNSLPISGYKLDLSNENCIIDTEQICGEYSNVSQYLTDFHKLFATKFNFAWGKLYNAKIIQSNNLMFANGVALVEDVLFNLDYYRHCKNGINAISYNGYYYRQHGNSSLSKKFNPKMFDWNEQSYTAVRDFLKEYGCFTDKNREHLYCNIAGNYQYGFYLIANNPQICISEKVAMIKKHMATPIYQDSLSVKQNKRIDYRILQWLLKHNMIRTYIYLENIKRKFLHAGN